jgi:hypothetical protein
MTIITMRIKNSLATIKLFLSLTIIMGNIFCKMSSLLRWNQAMIKLSYNNLKSKKLFRVKYALGVTMKINNLNIYPPINKRK